MNHPDQKYLDALRQDDSVVLDELYRRFSGKIKRMVLQNNGSESDAADIFQEALVAIFLKVKSGTFELTCPFEAFLFRVCKYKWINELAKRNRRPISLSDKMGLNIPDAGFAALQEKVVYEAKINIVKSAVSSLTEKNRKLMKLSWNKNSMKEVARSLKITYCYARKKKSECLAKVTALVRQSIEFNKLRNF